MFHHPHHSTLPTPTSSASIQYPSVSDPVSLQTSLSHPSYPVSLQTSLSHQSYPVSLQTPLPQTSLPPYPACLQTALSLLPYPVYRQIRPVVAFPRPCPVCRPIRPTLSSLPFHPLSTLSPGPPTNPLISLKSSPPSPPLHSPLTLTFNPRLLPLRSNIPTSLGAPTYPRPSYPVSRICITTTRTSCSFYKLTSPSSSVPRLYPCTIRRTTR